MKYTIMGFQQGVLMGFGMGVDEALILRTIVDFWFTGKMKVKEIDGKDFFFLSYAFLVAELPILGIDRRQLANKLDKMIACGLLERSLEKTGTGTRAWFRIDEELYSALIETPVSLEAAPKEAAPKEDPLLAGRREVKEYFTRFYLLKAKEILGTDTTPEGHKLVPKWGAKEAALLVQDQKLWGTDGIKRFIRLFFSDQIQEVARFTRLYNKAGYSYTVFHGVLKNLVEHKIDIKEPCIECGMWRGHKPSCSCMVEANAERARELEEGLKAREELASIDLMAMFEDKVRKRGGDGSIPPSEESAESIPGADGDGAI